MGQRKWVLTKRIERKSQKERRSFLSVWDWERGGEREHERKYECHWRMLWLFEIPPHLLSRHSLLQRQNCCWCLPSLSCVATSVSCVCFVQTASLNKSSEYNSGTYTCLGVRTALCRLCLYTCVSISLNHFFKKIYSVLYAKKKKKIRFFCIFIFIFRWSCSLLSACSSCSLSPSLREVYLHNTEMDLIHTKVTGVNSKKSFAHYGLIAYKCTAPQR